MNSAKERFAALYIRVSTDAQREEGYSIDAQKEMLTAHCISRGIKSYRLYIDGGFTGSNIERPAVNDLIKDVKDDLVSAVIVYKLDRLSRSQKDTLYLIEDVFNPHKTGFVSLNENMDTSTPIGRAMLGIMSAFAQLERETIRERTRMGMKERVKSGLWMGGGRIPFGYDYDKESGILVPNRDALTVRKIYELYLQGYSPNKIAAILGLKYEKLAVQILKRKANTGIIVYNGQEYQGQHEPIVSTETYEKAMVLMRKRGTDRTPASGNLLAGIIYCGKCGARMRYQKWGKSGMKLYCYSQQKSKPYLIKNPDCDNERMWADEAESAVINDLFAMGLDKTEQAPVTSYNVPELLRRQYDEQILKIRRLYNLYAKSGDELLLQTLEENRAQLKSLAEQIRQEEVRAQTEYESQELRIMVQNLKDTWEYMTPQERQRIIKQCVNRIVITDGQIDIYYNFDYPSANQ